MNYIGVQVSRPEPITFHYDQAFETEAESVTGADGKIAYWRAKRGKLRLAGNSKPRPGEELVYLTKGEAGAVV